MSEQAIEQEIKDKGKTAPRITPQHIDETIDSTHFFTAAEGVIAHGNLNEGEKIPEVTESLKLLTFCVLVLKNGFTVTGESACASPENFDPEIGRKIAYTNARDKIWPLEGYLLKQKLHSN